MEPLIHIIDPETKPDRIDRVLSSQFSHSRTYFQQIIAQQGVTVNGIAAIKPSFMVKPGDRIEIVFPAVRPLGALPLPAEDMGASILLTHEDFYIVFKPAGLMTHAPRKDSDIVTLVDWLVHTSAELTSVGQPERPGIVHRLDKDTSGIIIIPRNNVAHAYFSALFQQRLIEKTYLAIVQGHPEKNGTIDYPIGRDYKQMHKMTHQPHIGRAAVTQYDVVEYLEDAALVAVKPVTGRTHQIRVHMAAIGHPIIGDAVYGNSHPLITRQALHAHQLSFIYKEQLISCWHDMPEDMRMLAKQLRKK